MLFNVLRKHNIGEIYSNIWSFYIVWMLWNLLRWSAMWILILFLNYLHIFSAFIHKSFRCWSQSPKVRTLIQLSYGWWADRAVCYFKGSCVFIEVITACQLSHLGTVASQVTSILNLGTAEDQIRFTSGQRASVTHNMKTGLKERGAWVCWMNSTWQDPVVGCCEGDKSPLC
jgi:hypothetical protein